MAGTRSRLWRDWGGGRLCRESPHFVLAPREGGALRKPRPAGHQQRKPTCENCKAVALSAEENPPVKTARLLPCPPVAPAPPRVMGWQPATAETVLGFGSRQPGPEGATPKHLKRKQ